MAENRTAQDDGEAPRIGEDLRDLMAAVGEVLRWWGFLETAILERTTKLVEGGTKPHPFSMLVKAWVDAETVHAGSAAHTQALVRAMEEPWQVRNIIAHGLSSAYANPFEKDAAFVTCRSLGGECGPRRITILELRNAQEQLRRIIREVSGGPVQPSATP